MSVFSANVVWSLQDLLVVDVQAWVWVYCLGTMVILPSCGLISCANKLDSYGCSDMVTVNYGVFRTGLI